MANETFLKVKNKIFLGFAWVFGILFWLIGLIGIFQDFIPGILFLIIAALLIPPAIQQIETNIKLHISTLKKIGIIFILFIWVGIFGKTPSTASIPTPPTAPILPITLNLPPAPKVEKATDDGSYAFKLATIESQWSPTPELVSQFADILSKLQKTCPKEPENILSDYIVKSQELIRKDGKEISLLEVAKGINNSIPKEAVWAITCKEVAAAFVTLYQAQGKIPEPTETKPVEAPKPVPTPEPKKLGTIETIESAVAGVGQYEVTVWKGKNFAKDSSKPPFEVIVNSGVDQIGDCFSAKSQLFDVMKAIYTNPDLSGKIARVKYTAWWKLRASLWSSDLGFSWSDSGPSNFWMVLQKYKSYEDETSALNQRTYGVKIDQDCE